ncbi:MAG: Z1 domain-containing protein, partial [Bacteroidota bacterium]
YRKGNFPVHPITRAGEKGDLRKNSLPNHPINTNDYYAIVVKKNPSVLRELLRWLHAQGEDDGDYRIIKNAPLLVIDDEADYASINVDKDFVSTINRYIRGILALFEQSAFVGYTATPFANVFISDHNDTGGADFMISRKKFRLGDLLFPRDFIINLPPPSNYIGYSKVFDTIVKGESDYRTGDLPMTIVIDDYLKEIPKGHKKDQDLPGAIPYSLKKAIRCFVVTCAVRCARGQRYEHNSMLIHVSWYVRWIDRIALLVNKYLEKIKDYVVEDNTAFLEELKEIWENEFKSNSDKILGQIGYEDSRIISHDWEEILTYLKYSVNKIETRAVHGTKKDLEYANNTPLNYSEFKQGLSVIAVGGNKLSRGLTLEGLSISYFLRASRFYDTLLQMGRWFGYRPGYVDLCRLFTTDELITWYQHIANSTEELKEQFDIMKLADRTPQNFGLKVRSAPGMLMISSASKIRGATDLMLSFSGELIESYMLSKNEDYLNGNLTALNQFISRLGPVSGKVRQNQNYIWENVEYVDKIDEFIEDYYTNQPSLHASHIRGYIGRQLRHGRLKNWTVVLINNSKADEYYKVSSQEGSFTIGCTFRMEKEEKDAFGNLKSNPINYFIRKSHIISPPHEYLDMDKSDPRYIRALEDTEEASNAKTLPKFPRGKFIRKHRGIENALMLIYVLDPKGFNGKNGMPAVGYALSLPSIDNDDKFPYKVNQQFINELFEIPDDAEENPNEEDE